MNRLSRRTFLRSASATVLLPILESNAVMQGAFGSVPRRLVFLPMGYGVHPETWFPDPTQVGTDWDVTPSLMPFDELGLKSDISILQNLTNKYYVNGHTGSTTFLTSANPRAIAGVSFSNTVSCDQVAAEVLGQNTRHMSLAIGYQDGAADGHGGSSYQYASWGRNGKPVGVYQKLEDLYAALFGAQGVSKEQVRSQLARKKSSLDALMQDAKSLNHQISANDRDRIDEYFTSIRSIETRLSKANQWVDRPYPEAPFPLPKEGAEQSNEEMMRLTFDLMATALQSDSTRVLSYMMPSSGILQDFDSPISTHNMSHHGGKEDWTAVQRKRDTTLSKLVAEFLKKLKDSKEHDGSSILDHSLVAMGSSLRRGHGQANGPMVLAGHGGGGLKQGQNLVYEENETPLSNLWLSMIRHVGGTQEQFADSEGVLKEVGFS